MTSPQSHFDLGLESLRSQVFAANPDLPDHRDTYPWLTGSLGDPFSPVWFIAENPSLTQVERAEGSSPELQWSVSPGDRLLRETLALHGFKVGGPLAHGDWRCYITDVVKSAARVTEWSGTTHEHKQRVAEAWAPALAYELEVGAPRYLVYLGKAAAVLTTHLQKVGLVPDLPPGETIPHYSYVMSRPAGRVGPGHPDRVAAWQSTIGDIVRRYPPRAG